MSKQKADHIDRTIRQEQGRLLNFIRQFVPRREEAEDILQDVFVQLVVGYDNIRSMDQLTSWLFRVARNKVTDSYRKKKPVSFTEIGFRTSNDEDAPMLADLLPSADLLPEQELMSEMIWSKIDETLARLPDSQRQVFIWHEFEQKSFKEMQEMTGETVNTLLSRKRYAVMALRASLEELYKELIND